MRAALTGTCALLLASLTVMPRPGGPVMPLVLITLVALPAACWLGLRRLRYRWRTLRFAVTPMPGGAPSPAVGPPPAALAAPTRGERAVHRPRPDRGPQAARGSLLRGRGVLPAAAAPPVPTLCERLVAAREEERLRLRVDLHDSLGPALAGIRLRLDAAAERVAQPSARRLILDAANEASRTVDDIRRIIDDLRPPDLEDAGLAEALERLARRVVGQGVPLRLDVTVPAAPPQRRPALATEVAAYRIASEGLANVLRHARARTATLRLFDRGRWLVVEVVDDGVGPPAAGSCGDGVGLASMVRRAEEVGGHCAVGPRSDGRAGTVVRAVLPREAS